MADSSSKTFLPRYARSLLWLVVAAYAAYAAHSYYRGYAAASAGERPLYTDFTHAYAASLLLREQPAENLFYDDKLRVALGDAARAAYGPSLSEAQVRAVGFAAWMYPPTFLFLITPLAFLPYLASFLAWIGVTGFAYLAAMRSTVRDASAWPIALAAPPAFTNLMFGQTGFLSAGLIGLGLAQVLQRPLLAGLFIGLASVKPHLGLLIPIALAAGGHWRTFGIATATTLALVVASAMTFGMEPWYGTIGSIGYYLDGFQAGGYNFKAMTSVLGTFRLAGASAAAMWTAQHVSTAAMAGLVAWVWWRGRKRPDTLGLQSAVLCCAAPLAVPMVFVYDLVILTPAAAWLWCDFQAHGFRRWEAILLIGSLGALLATFPIAIHVGMQIGSACVAILLGLSLYRYLSSLSPDRNRAAAAKA